MAAIDQEPTLFQPVDQEHIDYAMSQARERAIERIVPRLAQLSTAEFVEVAQLVNSFQKDESR